MFLRLLFWVLVKWIWLWVGVCCLWGGDVFFFLVRKLVVVLFLVLSNLFGVFWKMIWLLLLFVFGLILMILLLVLMISGLCLMMMIVFLWLWRLVIEVCRWVIFFGWRLIVGLLRMYSMLINVELSVDVSVICCVLLLLSVCSGWLSVR